MEINKKNRTELKSYFLANKIPTEENFEDFVDANLNQAEDGIAKVQGNPIALQSEGDPAGTQEVLAFYTDFADPNPNWGINLNPRVDPSVPASNKPGLNFTDPTGASQLFIKSGDGNVGIGSIEPQSRLSVEARGDTSVISVTSEATGSARLFEVAQENNNGLLTVSNGNGQRVSQVSGAEDKASFFLSQVGVGTDDPKVQLHVSGEAAELRVTNTENGRSPHLTLQGSNGKSWNITSDESKGSMLHLRPTGSGEKGVEVHRDGALFATGGVNFGQRSDHMNTDGSMYRLGGKLFLSIDDDFFIRDSGGISKFHIDSDTGRMGIGGLNPGAPLSIFTTGKTQVPDGAMHISNGCILFGGNNTAGRNSNSAQISAGKHRSNSLNIVGMTSGGSNADRRIDMWAEGGLTVRGHIMQTKVVAFSAYVASNSLTNARNPLPMTNVTTNIGGAYDTSKSTFTAPLKGLYLFSMSMYKIGNDTMEWLLVRNGTSFVNGFGGGEPNEKARLMARLNAETACRTVVTILNKGDKITVMQTGKGRAENYRSGWEGVLLHALTE